MSNNEKLHDLAAFGSMVRKDEKKSTIKTILLVIGILSVAGVIAYCIYRFFAPDYMDDFDDEFDDDFDDSFFDEEAEEKAFVDDEKD